MIHSETYSVRAEIRPAPKGFPRDPLPREIAKRSCGNRMSLASAQEKDKAQRTIAAPRSGIRFQA
jgi:hypothetical protein